MHKNMTLTEYVIKFGEMCSANEIAEKFNVSSSYVYPISKRNGIRLMRVNTKKKAPKVPAFLKVFNCGA